MIDDVDAVTLALLAELAELDADSGAPETRVERVRSAHALAQQLSALGGGSLGEEKVAALVLALESELGP